MSKAEEWSLTVPADGADLRAELRRHGVSPGQRLRVARQQDDEAPADAPAFFGVLDGGPDLSEQVDEILR